MEINVVSSNRLKVTDFGREPVTNVANAATIEVVQTPFDCRSPQLL